MGSNSTSDTSNDVDVSFKYLNKADVTHKEKEESVYWADDGDENEEELELKKLDGLSKCLQCGTDGKPINIRYCSVCWRKRKDWVPSYSKSFNKRRRKLRQSNNKRRRKLRQSNNQETKQQTVTVALDHSTSTTTDTTTTTITVRTATKDLCMFCLTRERTTSLVHGRIAHQVVQPLHYYYYYYYYYY